MDRPRQPGRATPLTDHHVEGLRAVALDMMLVAPRTAGRTTPALLLIHVDVVAHPRSHPPGTALQSPHQPPLQIITDYGQPMLCASALTDAIIVSAGAGDDEMARTARSSGRARGHVDDLDMARRRTAAKYTATPLRSVIAALSSGRWSCTRSPLTPVLLFFGNRRVVQVRGSRAFGREPAGNQQFLLRRGAGLRQQLEVLFDAVQTVLLGKVSRRRHAKKYRRHRGVCH
jgi:hypothetical protein